MKKFILTLLILSLFIAVLPGCQSGGENEVVATIGSETITRGELKFYIERLKADYIKDQTEEQLETFWETEKDGKKPEETIREKALELYTTLTVTAAKAKENKFSVSSTEVDKTLEKNFNSAALTEMQTKYNITKETLKNVIKKQILTNQYNTMILKKDPRYTAIEEGMKKIFAEKFIKAQHILKMTVAQDQSQTPLPQDQKDAKKKEIEALLAKAKAGEDFSALMSKNSEDPGSQSQPAGYVFKEGDMVEEFYNAAKNLKENEISGIVESSYGYHDLSKDYEANKSKLPAADLEKQDADIQAIIDEMKATLAVSIKDDKIKAIPVR